MLRTRFKNEIVCEFLPPHLGRRTVKKQKVIILAGGLPASPFKNEVAEFLSKKGFWVFIPRYRGSWESGGVFLKDSPHHDMLDVIDQLSRGFRDVWAKNTYKISPDQLYVIGSSFGGPAAILSSLDKRVTKVVALSPVVDFAARSKLESFSFLKRLVAEGYGQAYRLAKDGWKKLAGGKFYNPMSQVEKFDGSKILMLHSADDEIVLPGPVKKFAKLSGARLKMYKTAGHMGISDIIKPGIYKQINDFIKP